MDILVHDAEARKSVFHGFAGGNSAIGPVNIEICMIMTFDDLDQKVVEMKEMFDSAAFGSFLANLKQHMDAKSGEEGQ